MCKIGYEWSEQEISFLKENYVLYPVKILQQTLTKRSKAAIEQRAMILNLPHRRKILNPGEALRRELFGTYKRNAKIRNHDFKLTENEFYELISQNCFMCGTPPVQPGRTRRRSNAGNFVYNGVDRYDNTKGYTLENSRACCGICNTAKNNLNVEQFESWLKKVVEKNRD